MSEHSDMPAPKPSKPSSEPSDEQKKTWAEQAQAQKKKIRDELEAEMEAEDAEEVSAAEQAEAERLVREQAKAATTEGDPAPSADADDEPNASEDDTTESEQLPKAIWAFDQAGADKELEAATTAANSFVRAEKSHAKTARELCLSVYDFITAIMPVDELKKLKESMQTSEDMVDGEIILPQEVSDYLQSKGMKAPHFRSYNPIMGIFQSIYQPARLKMKDGVKKETVEAIIAAAKDPENIKAQRKLQNRENAMASRLAGWVLAAVDMGDRKIIEDSTIGYDAAREKYLEWQEKGWPTLALPNPNKPRAKKQTPKQTQTAKTHSEEEDRHKKQQDDIVNAPPNDPLTANDEVIGGSAGDTDVLHDDGGQSSDEGEDDGQQPAPASDKDEDGAAINDAGGDKPATKQAAETPKQAETPTPTPAVDPKLSGKRQVMFEFAVGEAFEDQTEGREMVIKFVWRSGKLTMVEVM